MKLPAAPGADALAGLRVLDFTLMIAGPYGARLLADLGAEVIKIEPPEGEDMRPRAPLRGGHSAYFGQLNAGKRSIALDLKNAQAIGLVKKLVAEADVVLENFRPGVMQRLGLDYATLAAINPRLVYCSISGYGQTGPAAGRPAYAPIVHAASGFDRTLMRYAGDRTQPMHGAVFIADLLGGIYAYAGIQTALVQRTRTGLGQHVDVALMDCMLNLLVYELQEAQFPVPAGRARYGPIRAADGDLLVAPISQRNFVSLCKVIGRPELCTDARFAKTAARGTHWLDLMAEVQLWTRVRPLSECVRLLEAGGVPCSTYGEPGDALSDPHLIARGLFARVTDGGGEFTGINPPFRMSASRAQLGERVPAVGEHAKAILHEVLGMAPAEIDALRAAGAFGIAP